MCGRYTLSSPGEELAEVFGLEESVAVEARFNIAPTQTVPVVRERPARKRELSLLRWGLVPRWAEAPSIGSRMINARSESIAQKPAFRESLARRRCLVPADGFYEWQPRAGGKQPFFFSLADGGLFAMAGLWERWSGGAEALETFTIITTDANREVSEIHHRMPAILPAATWPGWLDPAVDDPSPLQELLRPAPDGLLALRPVSRQVNSPTVDSSACIEAIDLAAVEDDPQASLF